MVEVGNMSEYFLCILDFLQLYIFGFRMWNTAYCRHNGLVHL